MAFEQGFAGWIPPSAKPLKSSRLTVHPTSCWFWQGPKWGPFPSVQCALAEAQAGRLWDGGQRLLFSQFLCARGAGLLSAPNPLPTQGPYSPVSIIVLPPTPNLCRGLFPGLKYYPFSSALLKGFPTKVSPLLVCRPYCQGHCPQRAPARRLGGDNFGCG